jgi:hypothetical protein
MGELTPSTARELIHLAQQPLLLLMLALYSADPNTVGLEAETSRAELYRSLIEQFARREVTKGKAQLSDEEREEAIDEYRHKLTVAALAMFNRGRQDVSDVDLGADLVALDERRTTGSRPAQLGAEVIGKFFFVHADQATISTGESRRRYEFLHATFGEYLVAAKVIDELVNIAVVAFGGRRENDIDDDLLFAVISQQPLGARRTILRFAQELFAECTDDERRWSLTTLSALLESIGHRTTPKRYERYEPLPPDNIRAIATYSANLVLLYLHLSPDGRLRLDPSGQEPVRWRSLAALWRAGLSEESWQVMLSIVSLTGGTAVVADPSAFGDPAFQDVQELRFQGHEAAARRMLYGHAINGSAPSLGTSVPGLVDDAFLTWLAAVALRGGSVSAPPPLASTADVPSPDIHRLIALVLRTRSAQLHHASVEILLQVALAPELRSSVDYDAVAIALVHHPGLAERHPELRDLRMFSRWPLAQRLIRLVLSDDPAARGQLELVRQFTDMLTGPEAGHPAALPELTRTQVENLVETLTRDA